MCKIDNFDIRRNQSAHFLNFQRIFKQTGRNIRKIVDLFSRDIALMCQQILRTDIKRNVKFAMGNKCWAREAENEFISSKTGNKETDKLY